MDPIISWLLDGDPSVQYLTRRFLLHESEDGLRELRQRIASEGFAAEILSRRSASGHWGLHWYQPKWTSTHYALFDLMHLYASPETTVCREMCERMLAECLPEDGGLNLAKTVTFSDLCVNGMALSYLAYFIPEHEGLKRLTDYILAHQRMDGGWTWYFARETGDPHTTICVLEGLHQYACTGNARRVEEILQASQRGIGFLYAHSLFMDGTDARFLKLTYPLRYQYSVLRVLYFFAATGVGLSPRLRPALRWLADKRGADGKWQLEHVYPGRVHVEMEARRRPSRFITEMAMEIFQRHPL